MVDTPLKPDFFFWLITNEIFTCHFWRKPRLIVYFFRNFVTVLHPYDFTFWF